jgi:hypothetical protein
MVLRPLEYDDTLLLWSDQIVAPGSTWQRDLDDAIERTKVAILLVSPAFLSSDFIRRRELPPLLEKYDLGETTIIPVILRPCLFGETEFKFPDPNIGPRTLCLSKLQSANPNNRPLNALSEVEQDQVLVSVARRVAELISAGVSKCR